MIKKFVIKKIIITISLALLALLGVAYFFYPKTLSQVQPLELSEVRLPNIGNPIQVLPQNTSTQNTSTQALAQTPSANRIFGSRTSESSSESYNDQRFGFSFEYPAGFNVGAFDDAGGRNILIQSAKKGIQIYIQPFDNETITPERILQDLPGTVIENPLLVKVVGAAAGASAGLAFNSFQPGLGSTFEVWFSRSGQLYQIMAKVKDRGLVEEILKRWKFNK